MGWFSRTDRTPPDHGPTVDKNSVVMKRLHRLLEELEEVDRDLRSAIERGKRPDAQR